MAAGITAQIVDNGFAASATFTPAATSHTAGDCVGAAASFSNMGSLGKSIEIRSASLMIADTAAAATAFRLYLYSVTPPSALADDAAWDLPAGDRASFLGYVDLGTAIDLGTTQWVQTTGINTQIRLAGTGLFGYLVNLTTLTLAAAAITVTLNAVG